MKKYKLLKGCILKLGSAPIELPENIIIESETKLSDFIAVDDVNSKKIQILDQFGEWVFIKNDDFLVDNLTKNIQDLGFTNVTICKNSCFCLNGETVCTQTYYLNNTTLLEFLNNNKDMSIYIAISNGKIINNNSIRAYISPSNP